MKQFVVQGKFDDEEWTSIMTGNQIIDRIDMRDYTGEELRVWDGNEFGEMTELEVHGCWHKFSDPLYIKVTYPGGAIAFDGYGTDH